MCANLDYGCKGEIGENAAKFAFDLPFSAKAFELEIIPGVKVAAQIGGKLLLICRTSGCESPVFSWRTQLDSPLGGTVSNEGSTSNLTMNPVTFENDHAYLCSAHCGSKKKEKGIKVELYCKWFIPFIHGYLCLFKTDVMNHSYICNMESIGSPSIMILM